MFDFEYAKEILKENIKDSRYIHTLGVIKEAVELAEFYKVDVNKAKIAALLHDSAKGNEERYFLQFKDKYFLEDDTLKDPVKSHQILGAIACREIYGVSDGEIIEAISCHTTGMKDMGDLSKLIYVADAIEENRAYKGVDKLRGDKFKGLNYITLKVMNHTLKYLLKTNQTISSKTIRARNYIIREEKDGRREIRDN